MPSVRIGCVQYLNTLPLIEGLRSWRDAELVAAVPSKLIDLLLGREVDVALCSVIDAARRPSGSELPVTLLPAGMIGSDGPTFTVRLFSSKPIAELDTIAVDTDSHTSVALLQVLMHRLHAKRIRVVDFDARERVLLGSPPSGRPELGSPGWPEAVLLIGDKVVTDAPPADLYPHQLDLGAAWKQLTGLPFVYAVWMCRAGDEATAEVRAAWMMLDRTRRHNATRLDWIVASRAADKHWPADQARTYLGDYLHYEIGEAERESVAKFLRFAAELGLCSPASPRWADELATSDPRP